MSRKRPIYPDRIRQISGSFSWIDHHFVGGGFLRTLSRDELLLYYFLVTVGDKNGVSFYSFDRICELLKMELDSYREGKPWREKQETEENVVPILSPEDLIDT